VAREDKKYLQMSSTARCKFIFITLDEVVTLIFYKALTPDPISYLDSLESYISTS